MKFVFALFFTLTVCGLSAQNQEEEKIILQKMCKHLIDHKEKPDSIRVFESYDKYLFPYLGKIETEKVDSIAESIFYRFQKECDEFFWILENENPLDKSESVFYDEEQKSVISDKELKEFKKHQNFYYMFDGNLTYVKIDNQEWLERFDDGTFSKTSLVWDSQNSFTLTFIESDNLMKKAYSRKGEKYQYQIIKKEDNYYWLQIKESSHGKFTNFKLYVAE